MHFFEMLTEPVEIVILIRKTTCHLFVIQFLNILDMKAITTVLYLVYLFSTSRAQAQKVDTAYPDPPRPSYNFYMKKRAINNTAGWILLGSGLIISSASFLTYVNNGFNGVWKQEGLFYFGGITAVAGIPFFVAAGANKRKARLSLKQESITPGKGISRSRYPAISISMSF